MTYEVVTLGEAMLRLWTNNGMRLETVESMKVSVGGSEANVAVALARAGHKVAWLSRLPNSFLGKRIANEIRMHGVDTSALSWSDDGRAGLYFVELSGSPRGVSVLYDRQGSASSQMSSLNTDLAVIRNCKLFHLSGITPALSSTCQQLCREALKLAKSAGVAVTFDINYRSALWSTEDAKKEVSQLASLSSLVVCTSRDAEDLYGLSQDDENLAQKLSNRLSVSNVIVTQGSNGVSWVLDGQNGSMDAQIVETIDRVGAGDSFMAGVISGFLNGNIVEGIRRGQAMASLKRGIYGDHLVVAETEIQDAMNGNNLEIRR
jgi:2-dehydro-3-deoxygluconokinase